MRQSCVDFTVSVVLTYQFYFSIYSIRGCLLQENIVTKSSQSTCSDGSLLSMGSSEIDEVSIFCVLEQAEADTHSYFYEYLVFIHAGCWSDAFVAITTYVLGRVVFFGFRSAHDNYIICLFPALFNKLSNLVMADLWLQKCITIVIPVFSVYSFLFFFSRCSRNRIATVQDTRRNYRCTRNERRPD